MQNLQTAKTINDWPIYKLGDICDIQTGKKDVNAESKDGIYPFFTCAQDIHKINTYTFDTEAVLVAGNGFFNVKHYKGKFDAYQRTYVLNNFKPSVMGKFVYHFVNAKLDEITKNNRGSTIRYIRLGDLSEQEIPIPAINIQQQIVSKLEELLDDVKSRNANIENTKKLLSKFRQAILTSAVSGRLTEEWREKHPDVESAQEILDEINLQQTRKIRGVKYINLIEEDSLPQIPDNWIFTHLGEVVSSFTYGTSQKSDYSFKGTPVLRIPNVISQEVNLDDLKYLPHMEEKENLLVNEGDILIVRSNGSRDLVGKNALVKNLGRPYAFASYLIRITPIVVLPEYVMIFLNSMLAKRQLFNQAKSAAGINNINSKELASLRLPLPPLSEQKDLTRRVNAMLEVSNKVEQQIELASKKAEKLTQAILAKAFRGEFVHSNNDLKHD